MGLMTVINVPSPMIKAAQAETRQDGIYRLACCHLKMRINLSVSLEVGLKQSFVIQ